MSLHDVLARGPRESARKPGKVEVFRAGLSDEDRAAFDAAIVDPAWTTSDLWRTLTGEGLKVSLSALTVYRRERAA